MPNERHARRAAWLFIALGAPAVLAGWALSATPCDHYASLGVSEAEMAAWLPPGVTLETWCAPFDAPAKATLATPALLRLNPPGDDTLRRWVFDGAPLPASIPAVPLPASGWLLLAALAGLAWWRR